MIENGRVNKYNSLGRSAGWIGLGWVGLRWVGGEGFGSRFGPFREWGSGNEGALTASDHPPTRPPTHSLLPSFLSSFLPSFLDTPCLFASVSLSLSFPLPDL